MKATKEKIKKNKSLTQYNIEELKYVQKPLGKSLYKNKVGRPVKQEKTKPSDSVICDICGGRFIRSNRFNHKKTKKHKIYEDMNIKLRNLLIGSQ
jgi:hypothetical protein